MTREEIFETLGAEDLKRLLEDHQKLLILYGFANAISVILDREVLLNEAMNVIFGLVKAERSAIFLWDPKTGKPVKGVSRDRQTEKKADDLFLGNPIIERVIKECKPILSPDVMKDPRFQENPFIQRHQIRSCLCVPLESQHHVLGILYADNREPHCFSKEELTLASGIATQTAVALENIESVHRIKEERRRVEGILKTLPLAILSINEEGIISFVNSKAEKLFNVSAKECLGRSYAAFLEGRLFGPLLELIGPALREGGKVKPEEITCGNSEKPLLLQINIVPLEEGMQRGILVVLEDITEKRTLEQDILNAEKLSAIGEMTAGLVHEIVNPLSIISGRAQLLQLEDGKDPAVSKAARVIQEQVERASSITERLLSFARQKPPTLRPVALHQLLEKYLEVMEEQFASNKIRVERMFANTPLAIMGDSEQLEEVFDNLARNAIQVMPEGGCFTVRTERYNGTVEVSFTDTGCGIPPEHLPKLFIPFFTTKSRGTGLGLSIVHGIVKNHGGEMKVQSQPGKGSTFTVILPLKEERKK